MVGEEEEEAAEEEEEEELSPITPTAQMGNRAA
jgi:hypothetical protein